jgi:hypothetical protein
VTEGLGHKDTVASNREINFGPSVDAKKQLYTTMKKSSSEHENTSQCCAYDRGGRRNGKSRPDGFGGLAKRG